MKKENTTGGKIRIEVYILAVLLLIAAATAVYFVTKSNNDRNQSDISVENRSENTDTSADGAGQELDGMETAIEKASAEIKARDDSPEGLLIQSIAREKVGLDNKYDIAQFNLSSENGGGWVEFWYREAGKGDLVEAFGGHEPPMCSSFKDNKKVIEAFQDDFCYSEEIEDATTFLEYFKETPQE
ncbi:MAG: hypothetical protein KIG14_02235 [Candidatus Sacchiramonaceae bacterium]|nr:hypothetical protein [Candidatus Saccharimonadaceae bacterium]